VSDAQIQNDPPDAQTQHGSPADGSADDAAAQTRWSTVATWIVAIGGAITTLGGVAANFADLAKLPVWALIPVAVIGSVAITWILVGTRRAAVAAGIVALALGLGGWQLFDVGGDQGAARGDVHSGPRRPQPEQKFESWSFSVPADPERTVLYRDTVWTLVGGLLLRADAPGRMKLAPIDAPARAEDLLLCGQYLIILTAGGAAVLYDAEDGRRVRKYTFAAGGPADASACSPQYLWTLTDGELARVPIPGMATDNVKTWRFDPGVDELFYWKARVWTQDYQSEELIGYDEDTMAAFPRATLSGNAHILTLTSSLWAAHEGTSCARPIDIGTEREARVGTPLPDNATAFASDGRVGAIADRSRHRLTIVRDGVVDGVRTYELPLKDTRVTGLAINDDWVALEDESEPRVVVIRRSALGYVRNVTNRRLASCPG
jgi:hypothetical protein